VPPSREVPVVISVDDSEPRLAELIEERKDYFARLCRARDLEVGVRLDRPDGSIPVVVGRHELFVPLEELVDLKEERARLEKEIDQKEKFLAGIRKKLQNEQFLTRAPADVVSREQQKEEDALAEIQRLKINLAELT
jgi:valyl-tRNA synthetase